MNLTPEILRLQFRLDNLREEMRQLSKRRDLCDLSEHRLKAPLSREIAQVERKLSEVKRAERALQHANLLARQKAEKEAKKGRTRNGNEQS